MMAGTWRIERGRRGALGVTLIESMVTAGLAAVIMGVAVPSMVAMQHRQAVAAETASFRQGVHRARSEALRRGETVTLCALAPESVPTGEPQCLENGRDWSTGWLVFIDRGNTGIREADDPVLMVHQQRAAAGSVAATVKALSFHAQGFSSNAASHFRFVPPGAAPDSRGVPGSLLVCVNKPGRVRQTEADDCA